jgi:trehalose-6-phosphate synthase
VFSEEYYKELKEAIYEIYNKITGDFGEKVVEIIESSPDDIGRYIIWAETDVLFITNKRDGLYMSPLEYVVIRDAMGKSKKSSVLMSEFVGGSRLLNGAYVFNPYNIREMVK